MKADMNKQDNEIVVARNPPKKKLAIRGKKLTLLSQEGDEAIRAGERGVVGERAEEWKEWPGKVSREAEHAHRMQKIEYSARGRDEEDARKVYQEEKPNEDDEGEEEKEDHEEEEAEVEAEEEEEEEEEEEVNDVREISGKKWVGRYKWSEQMTDTYCKALVDIIRAGGRSDSGFQSPVWAEVCLRLKKKCGLQACTLTPKHCKDKYDNVSLQKRMCWMLGIQS